MTYTLLGVLIMGASRGLSYVWIGSWASSPRHHCVQLRQQERLQSDTIVGSMCIQLY